MNLLDFALGDDEYEHNWDKMSVQTCWTFSRKRLRIELVNWTVRWILLEKMNLFDFAFGDDE